MKVIVLIVSTLLAVQMQYGSAAPNKEKFMETLEKCKQKEGVEGSIIEAIKEKKLPESEEGKCLVACMFEEFGILKDNMYNKDGALEAAQKMFETMPEKMEKAKAVIETCSKEVSELTGNRCEVAFKIAECAKKNGDGDF